MNTYTLTTFILTLAVSFGYLNYRLLKLPSSIGLTVLALLASLVAILIQAQFPYLEIKSLLSKVLKEIRFEEAVLHWMLGFLLFAGALHVELETLLTRLKSILSLATLGVLLSTLITGSVIYFLGNFLGFSLPFLWCLIFGALIAPTDPVAVLAVLRKAGISLVLSLPFVAVKNVLLTLTYFNVLFSVVVQGLSLRPLTRYIIFSATK